MKLVEQTEVKFIKKKCPKVAIPGKMEKLCKKETQLQCTIWFISKQYLKGPNDANMIHMALSEDIATWEAGGKGCYVIAKYSASRIRNQQQMSKLNEFKNSRGHC